jgi:hypothetical protein
LVQVEVSFFWGEKATQLLAYKGLPDFLFKKSPNIAKYCQTCQVSHQNKTYAVTLMLRVVVGAESKQELFSL